MAGNYGDRSLEETPTWAVAIVCAVIVIVSFLIELGIHSLGKWFQKRRNKAMIESLEKMKTELMIMGFISLLLVVATSYIAKICIPVKVGHTMLPCRKVIKTKNKEDDSGDDGRKLLSYSQDMIWRRLLADANYKDYCGAKGKVSLISYYGVHQLHIFIFVLAVFHIIYSVLIMVLGQAKMKKWKAWELETSSLEYQFTNDPARFRFAHQTSFVRRHTGLSTTPGIRWILAFFRQFFGSISRVDYLTIRNGFINAHFAPNSKFDFHKYIKRSMEDDFKMVLGISVPLWMFAVVFLLLNVYKWYTLSWIALVPPLILLLVGTKLELVIMEMAQRIQDRATVVRGALVVEPSDNYFWFNQPQWILFLIHFTLFQNAFQMAFFLWAVYEFGIKSCLHENLVEVVLRVCFGVAIHIMCSYITFPLYALVTQMGSNMKQPIFDEQTAKALKKWRKASRDKKKQEHAVAIAGTGAAADDSNVGESENNTPSRDSSPVYLLHRYRSGTTTSAVDSESVPNPFRVHQSDIQLSNIHAPTPEQTDYPEIKEECHGVGFIFGKP